MIFSTTPERFAEFVHNSNLIEGVSELDYSDILKDTKNLLSQKENRTHTGALAKIYEFASEQQNFNLTKLLKIHEQITSEQLVLGHFIETKYIGAIRDCGVRIGFSVIAPPKKTDLINFFRNFNKATKSINSKNLFKILSEQHLIFERIHPFADGNGRTGRLLMLYQFLFAQFGNQISKKIKIPIIKNSSKHIRYYSAFGIFDTGEKEMAINYLDKFLKLSTKK
jgi:Fic family protein